MTVDLLRIKAERVAKGFTQDYVAKEIGMNRSSYIKRENGNVPFGADELAQVAELLGHYSDIQIFFTMNVPERKQ
ncbi:MAG: helix-turn-helix transcriptional regulator [Bacillota bacterium]|nr:helix-turn-helix transcriptional regulator [Bacillota bacterium]